MKSLKSLTIDMLNPSKDIQESGIRRTINADNISKELLLERSQNRYKNTHCNDVHKHGRLSR